MRWVHTAISQLISEDNSQCITMLFIIFNVSTTFMGIKKRKTKVYLCHIIGMVAFVHYIINYEKM